MCGCARWRPRQGLAAPSRAGTNWLTILAGQRSAGTEGSACCVAVVAFHPTNPRPPPAPRMRVTPAPLAVAAVVLSTVLALVGAAPAAAKGVPVHVDLAGDDLCADGTAERPFRTLLGLRAAAASSPALLEAAAGLQFGPGMHDLVATNGLNITKDGFTIKGAGAGATFLTGE